MALCKDCAEQFTGASPGIVSPVILYEMDLKKNATRDQISVLIDARLQSTKHSMLEYWESNKEQWE